MGGCEYTVTLWFPLKCKSNPFLWGWPGRDERERCTPLSYADLPRQIKKAKTTRQEWFLTLRNAQIYKHPSVLRLLQCRVPFSQWKWPNCTGTSVWLLLLTLRRPVEGLSFAPQRPLSFHIIYNFTYRLYCTSTHCYPSLPLHWQKALTPQLSNSMDSLNFSVCWPLCCWWLFSSSLSSENPLVPNFPRQHCLSKFFYHQLHCSDSWAVPVRPSLWFLLLCPGPLLFSPYSQSPSNFFIVFIIISKVINSE